VLDHCVEPDPLSRHTRNPLERTSIRHRNPVSSQCGHSLLLQAINALFAKPSGHLVVTGYSSLAETLPSNANPFAS
jgi:hypothetical protein